MNKRLMWTGIFLTIIGLLIFVPDIANALLAFMFVGIIPGTDMSLPFWAMGLFIVIAAAIAIVWLGNQSLYIGDRSYQQKQAKAAAREYVLEHVAATSETKAKAVRRAPAKRRAKTATKLRPVKI